LLLDHGADIGTSTETTDNENGDSSSLTTIIEQYMKKHGITKETQVIEHSDDVMSDETKNIDPTSPIIIPSLRKTPYLLQQHTSDEVIEIDVTTEIDSVPETKKFDSEDNFFDSENDSESETNEPDIRTLSHNTEDISTVLSDSQITSKHSQFQALEENKEILQEYEINNGDEEIHEIEVAAADADLTESETATTVMPGVVMDSATEEIDESTITSPEINSMDNEETITTPVVTLPAAMMDDGADTTEVVTEMEEVSNSEAHAIEETTSNAVEVDEIIEVDDATEDNSGIETNKSTEDALADATIPLTDDIIELDETIIEEDTTKDVDDIEVIDAAIDPVEEIEEIETINAPETIAPVADETELTASERLMLEIEKQLQSDVRETSVKPQKEMIESIAFDEPSLEHEVQQDESCNSSSCGSFSDHGENYQNLPSSEKTPSVKVDIISDLDQEEEEPELKHINNDEEAVSTIENNEDTENDRNTISKTENNSAEEMNHENQITEAEEIRSTQIPKQNHNQCCTIS